MKPNNRSLYTVAEGYEGEFVIYTVDKFTDEEISIIDTSIRRGGGGELFFPKRICKSRYAFVSEDTIKFCENFATGMVTLSFSQIDTFKIEDQTAYGLFGEIKRTEVYSEHPEDGINLDLFFPNSPIMVYCDEGLSQAADFVRYLIPNPSIQEFSRDDTVDLIGQLDLTYPEIGHPYACLYGILPDVLEAYGSTKWFRPNNFTV